MAVDMTIELFSVDLFRHLWYEIKIQTSILPRPARYGNKAPMESEFNNEILGAVCCRISLFHTLVSRDLEQDYAKFSNSNMDFYMYLKSKFSDFKNYDDPNVFDKVFITAAFVAEMTISCLSQKNSMYEGDAMMSFAMFFDAELKKEFYAKGGWKNMNIHARKYYSLILRTKDFGQFKEVPAEADCLQVGAVAMERAHINRNFLNTLFQERLNKYSGRLQVCNHCHPLLKIFFVHKQKSNMYIILEGMVQLMLHLTALERFEESDKKASTPEELLLRKEMQVVSELLRIQDTSQIDPSFVQKIITANIFRQLFSDKKLPNESADRNYIEACFFCHTKEESSSLREEQSKAVQFIKNIISKVTTSTEMSPRKADCATTPMKKPNKKNRRKLKKRQSPSHSSPCQSSPTGVPGSLMTEDEQSDVKYTLKKFLHLGIQPIIHSCSKLVAPISPQRRYVSKSEAIDGIKLSPYKMSNPRVDNPNFKQTLQMKDILVENKTLIKISENRDETFAEILGSANQESLTFPEYESNAVASEHRNEKPADVYERENKESANVHENRNNATVAVAGHENKISVDVSEYRSMMPVTVSEHRNKASAAVSEHGHKVSFSEVGNGESVDVPKPEYGHKAAARRRDGNEKSVHASKFEYGHKKTDFPEDGNGESLEVSTPNLRHKDCNGETLDVTNPKHKRETSVGVSEHGCNAPVAAFLEHGNIAVDVSKHRTKKAVPPSEDSYEASETFCENEDKKLVAVFKKMTNSKTEISENRSIKNLENIEEVIETFERTELEANLTEDLEELPYNEPDLKDQNSLKENAFIKKQRENCDVRKERTDKKKEENKLEALEKSSIEKNKTEKNHPTNNEGRESKVMEKRTKSNEDTQSAESQNDSEKLAAILHNYEELVVSFEMNSQLLRTCKENKKRIETCGERIQKLVISHERNKKEKIVYDHFVQRLTGSNEISNRTLNNILKTSANFTISVENWETNLRESREKNNLLKLMCEEQIKELGEAREKHLILMETCKKNIQKLHSSRVESDSASSRLQENCTHKAVEKIDTSLGACELM